MKITLQGVHLVDSENKTLSRRAQLTLDLDNAVNKTASVAVQEV